MEEALGIPAKDLAALLARGVSFTVTISPAEAQKAVYTVPIKNFDRSPGGFTEADARAALAAFRSDFPL